jgi:AraC-like DNA-binding protein
MQCQYITNLNKNDTPWDDMPKPTVQMEIFAKKIDRYYASNPDSALYYCKALVEKYKIQNNPYQQYNLYFKISEIYLHHKSDNLNAIRYYGDAMKLMINSNGNDEANPYFYIDFGNMYYINKIPDRAILNYKKSIEIAVKQKNNYAVSLGLNNIGQAYQSDSKLDSARIYYHKAVKVRKNILPVLEAQSYNSLARTYLNDNKPDSLNCYITLIQDALKRQKSHQNSSKVMSLNDAKQLENELKIDNTYLRASYFKEINNPKKAIEFYKLNSKLAVEINDILIPIINNYKIAKQYYQLNDFENAIYYANASYQLAIRNKKYNHTLLASNLLSELYHKSANVSKEMFFLNKSLQISDSLNKMETSKMTSTSKMLLITTETENSLRQIKNEQIKEKSIIEIQTYFILILIIVLIAISYLLYVIYQKRKELRQKHLQQMNLFIKRLENNDIQKANHHQKEKLLLTKDQIKKLKNLINTEKIYTQNTISLSEFALMLGTNVNYLSQYLNIKLETNFNDFINSNRIEEACRIFKEDSKMKFSVEQVAEKVGFSSRSTFYSTFKKFTGVTPSFFQKNLHINLKNNS